MQDIAAILFSLFCIVVIQVGSFYTIKGNNYVIPNSEWNCTKSLMIDEKNVDRVECVRYEKVIKNDN